MNLEALKHIHFTGIKGVGMTALAIYLKSMGKKVTGSDVAEVFVTDETLKKNKISWKVGFGEQNLKPKPDLLITTAAHGGYLNPEVKLAGELGIPVTSYAEFMSKLANTKKVISVCGVGGKTTTASMISVLLVKAKLKPTYVIGVGEIFPIGSAGKYEREGKYFICEADDYVISPGVDDTPKFMLLDPFITVVTNIEYDHQDIYKSFEDTKRAFGSFFNKIPKDGLLVASGDSTNVMNVVRSLKKPLQTYGLSKMTDWQIRKVKYQNQETHFDLYEKKNKRVITDLVLSVPGEFNVRNATATFIVGDFLGIGEEVLRQGLVKYKGCRRRFEKMGEFRSAIYFDDYAHHPSEIVATLRAAREWFPKKRIVAIFQPHTFSRTRALFKEFSTAFKEADVVGLMDIYASARESFDSTISSEMLAEEAKKYQKEVYYLGNHERALEWINKEVKKDDVVLTMGAGDVFHLYNKLHNPKVSS